MTQSPYPARPGETVELTVSLQNQGSSDLSDITVSVDAEYPFSQVSGESLTKTISFLEARQDEEDATLIKFKLKVDSDVSDGTYDVDVIVKDSDSDSSSRTTLEVEVQGKEYAQIVTISDSSIDVATVEPLEFVITNTGSSDLQNIEVSWEEATGVVLPVYSSNTKYINSLGVGESATVVYSVMADVDADPGLYQLDITLEFEDYDSDTTLIETKAGLFVGGTTDFDLSYSESDEGEVSLSLANVGNNEAYSVKVSIPEQDNFQATGSTSTIVGNLEKGDYTITSFSISQTSSMSSMDEDSDDGTASAEPGEMTEEDMEAMQEEMEAKSELLVNIEYTDSAGQRHTVEKAVQIEELTGGTMGDMAGGPGGQSSSSNSYLLYGAVALVVVVVGFNYRKKKMMKAGNYVPLNVELRNLKAKILKKD
ncbi:hypothetical protein FKV42_07780 [Methanolobus vulcani]|uniref:Uncharacterized protein n=2 Tax=Methanolobus vulcani TaxID=38026 RepID=A0A7Z8KNJ3_9EURY|nr:hypothetical protein FKV42_07780 [Methanolobus vulcani]